MDQSSVLMDEASSLVFKETSNAQLHAFLFFPEGHVETDERTAVSFFSAGVWDNCKISQFAPHCLHFRNRGAVAVIFEYREISKHHISPLEAVADARSAVRWLRMNHDALGIHPERLVTCGASGGAHLCLSTAMLEGYDVDTELSEVSCVPNAMGLFSPIVDTTKKGVGMELFRDPKEAKKTSPSRNIRKGLPPSVLFQGTNDRVVDAAAVAKFQRVMKRKKNACALHPYNREGHSFFNFNCNMQHFESTLNTLDRFLVDLGLLSVDNEDDGSNRLAS